MSPQPIAQIEKPVHIPLPTSTRARLRAAMASLDRPTPDQSHRLSEARTLLGIFGLRFADLPELLPALGTNFFMGVQLRHDRLGG